MWACHKVSPLLSNIYLNEVDRMRERAKEVTRNGKYSCIEYACFADDLVLLNDAHRTGCCRRLRNAFGRN